MERLLLSCYFQLLDICYWNFDNWLAACTSVLLSWCCQVQYVLYRKYVEIYFIYSFNQWILRKICLVFSKFQSQIRYGGVHIVGVMLSYLSFEKYCSIFEFGVIYCRVKFPIIFNINFFCVGVMYSGEYDACDVTLRVLCISTPGKLEKYAWPRWESNLRPLEY